MKAQEQVHQHVRYYNGRMALTDPRVSSRSQSDFLEKIARQKPVQALAELIWNGLDADTPTSVSVTFDYNALGAMSAVIVADNGQGISYAEAPQGVSPIWRVLETSGALTKGEGRFLHGQRRPGPIQSFSLGRFADGM